MELIEILKGARNRIETAEYLSEGYYFENHLKHGQCYCAVGHMLKEMGAEDQQIKGLEVAYIGEFDFDNLTVLNEEIKLLTKYEGIIFELQKINDDSTDDNRKANVLEKLDNIIKTLEVDGTWKSK